LLALLVLLQVPPPSSGDTLRLRAVARPPAARFPLDSVGWGTPQVRIPTRQGVASVWLLRALDTVFVVASIPDRSRSWSDALAVCVDASGDRAAAPAHDDFRWSLQRTLDSSVVYRGRSGRWEPPLNDPDWRIGAERAGGGWELGGTDGPSDWAVVLRLDPAWLEGEQGHRPRIGFTIHDDDPNGWYAWPAVSGTAGAPLLERTPAMWVPLE
jgi:hypothetical protein